MNTKPIKLIAYRRVSTARQGTSGLGLEAQDEAINKYAQNENGQLIKVYTEIESGKRNDRPELARALDHAKAAGARLVVAKLDRLTRNTRFLLGIVESGAEVAFCDLPSIPPGHLGKFFLTQMAAIAELERGMISQRTKDALAAYKARGGVMGSARPECRDNLDRRPGSRARGAKAAGEVAAEQARGAYGHVAPLVVAWRAEGLSQRAIADRLNADGHTTRRGKPWNQVQVKRVLERFPA